MEQSEELEFVQAYKNHLKSMGCSFYKASSVGNNQSRAQVPNQGQWIVGPQGTYLFSFVSDYYPYQVMIILFEQMEKSLSYPNKFNNYFINNGGVVEGMNYYADQQMLDQAIKNQGFYLNFVYSANYVTEGNPEAMTRQYFHNFFSYTKLKGDVTPILNYLMSGMTSFQSVCYNNDGSQKSGTQILCLVSMDQFWLKANTQINSVFSSQVTKNEVTKVFCGSTSTTKVTCNYTAKQYLQPN